MAKLTKVVSKPCRNSMGCRLGFDHCFNCDRHLDANGHCPHGCDEDPDAEEDDDDQP